MTETVRQIFESSFIGGLLLLVLWGIWKGAVAIHHDIFVPIKSRIILHIDKLDEATESMKGWIKAQGQLINDQTQLIKNQTVLIQRQAKETDDNAETLHRIDVNVKELHDRSSQFFAEAHREHKDKYPGGEDVN